MDVQTECGDDMILIYDDSGDGEYREIHKEQVIQDWRIEQ